MSRVLDSLFPWRLLQRKRDAIRRSTVLHAALNSAISRNDWPMALRVVNGDNHDDIWPGIKEWVRREASKA